MFQVRHEDRWTSFNDNWRQNASALLSRWCDPVMGGSAPGSAGVPPAQILPQLRPSPPPESTGSGALPLLRPGPCGSRRPGGRLQHRRETERQPKGQHAGGTPALPGVSSRWCGGGCLAGDFSESRPAPFGKLPFARESSPRPPRRVGSFESETVLFQKSCQILSNPFSFNLLNRICVIRTQGLFQTRQGKRLTLG